MISTLSFNRAKSSINLAKDVATQGLATLLFIHLTQFALEQGGLIFQQMRLANPTDESAGFLILYGITATFLTLGLSLLWIMVVARGLYDLVQGSKPTSLHFNYHQSLIEYLRAVTSSLCHSLFFLLPGLRRFICLIFTVHVSLFDKSYDEGKIDALAKSAKITKGRIWALLLLILLKMLLGLLLEGGLTFEGSTILENPIFVMINQLFQFALNLVFSCYLTLLFFDLMKLESTKKGTL